MRTRRNSILCLGIFFLLELLVFSNPVPAQEEAASAIRRFKEREFSTGYYEAYEVKPFSQRPLVGVPGVRRGLFPYSPTASEVRVRTRLADSHRGIKFYQNLRCDYCHIQETKDIHTVRAGLTCRQCHGGEPIASINHYFSPLNPIRRHAYVCSKCHEGSSASFASYVVHSPNPAQLSTLKSFPLLFYVFWAMVVLAVGTFAVFLPHAALWGVREVLVRKKRAESDRKKE
jgi:hypothetical protein